MKAITVISVILLNSLICFSQKDERTEILKVVIKDYCSDSIFISRKFENNELLEDLDEIKSNKEYELMSKSVSDTNNTDLSFDEMFADTATILIGELKVEYFSGIKLLKRNNKRDIPNLCPVKRANKDALPVLEVSTPIISVDGQHAIVYTSYYCGSLCGNGITVFLIKENEKWLIISTTIRWIS